METATGKCGLELRNERELETSRKYKIGRTGNIKKVQNHVYHVPEESWEEMNVEDPGQTSSQT